MSKSHGIYGHLDRPAAGHDMPLSALTDASLDGFIAAYAAIAECGRWHDETLIEQRDLDVVQTELRLMREERASRQGKDGAV